MAERGRAWLECRTVRRFLFDMFCFGLVLSLLATVVLWVRSESQPEDFHAWWVDGRPESDLYHVHAQSANDRVEIYLTRAVRFSAANQPVRWPDQFRPNHAHTEVLTAPRGTTELSFASSFTPTPESHNGFMWAKQEQNFDAEPGAQDPFLRGLKGSYGEPEKVQRTEYLLAFPYWFVMALLGLPLGWRLLPWNRTKRGTKAAGGAQSPVAGRG